MVALLVDDHRQFRTFPTSRLAEPSDVDDILQAAYLIGFETGDKVRNPERAVARQSVLLTLEGRLKIAG